LSQYCNWVDELKPWRTVSYTNSRGDYGQAVYPYSVQTVFAIIFYALTAHFGQWKQLEEGRPVWVLLNDIIYGQVISFAKLTQRQKRRRTVEVERQMQVGRQKFIESG
jgi:hypothetical protein